MSECDELLVQEGNGEILLRAIDHKGPRIAVHHIMLHAMICSLCLKNLVGEDGTLYDVLLKLIWEIIQGRVNNRGRNY